MRTISEQSPAFQLYPRDLLADTDNLTDAAFGLYVRLLCKQWLHGSLPAAFESEDGESMIELLPRDDVKERRRSWKAIGKHFKPHPTEDGRVVQARLERIREEQRAYRATQSANGRKGVDKRRQLGLLPPIDAEPTLEATGEPNGEPAVEATEQGSVLRRSTSATAPAPASASAKNNGTDGAVRGSGRLKWEPPACPFRVGERLPDDVTALKHVAVQFLREFANAHADDAIAKHGPAYTNALATFRSRGITIATAWQCFCDARQTNSGRPLFGESAKKAISFIPAGTNRRDEARVPVRAADVRRVLD